MRTKTTTMIVVGLVFLAAGTNLWAATITVTSDSGGTGGPDCTVRDAITAANTDTATGGCSAGSGADIIELPAGVTITLTLVDNSIDGYNGLPLVTSEMTINGNGATVERSSAATQDFRIFRNTSWGDLTLNNLTVTGGVASGEGAAGRGGGILISGGTVTLTHSTVSDNSAHAQGDPGPFPVPAGGGGIFNGGLLELTNSTVSGNSAIGVFPSPASGGGILNSQNDITTLTNSTVSGNSADGQGGGIFNYGALTLTNSTVSENSAFGGGGGGIYNGDVGELAMTNSIVANSLSGGDCFNNGKLMNVDDQGFNIVENGNCIWAPTSMSGDPNLGPLADNGGPTQTHALLPGSIAIDAITDPGACTVTTDQRGVSRPQGLFCDIGSFETTEVCSDTDTDTDGDGVPDDCDNCSLFNPDQADCQNNGVGDVCDLADGTSSDCNDNDTPDECDIAQGSSVDCNGNGVPDECESDTDGDGVPDDCDNCSLFNPEQADCQDNGVGDVCDIADGTSSDCDSNGVPDECNLAAGWVLNPATGNYYGLTLSTTWMLAEAEAVAADGHLVAIGSDDENQWLIETFPLNVWIGFNDVEVEGQWVWSNDVPAGYTNWISGEPNNSGNEDFATMSGASSGKWNDINPTASRPGIIEVPHAPEDCNGNDVLDECDIASGTSLDDLPVGGDGIPDECQADCNNNQIPDDLDLAGGSSADCNANGAPDECDTIDGTSSDCNGNNVPDECDLSPFPEHLSENTTGAPDSTYIGPPDYMFLGIGGQIVTYDLGDLFVFDGAGPDFNVYEVDYGGPEFAIIDVLVSEDGITFVSVVASGGPSVPIAGDDLHNNGDFAQSYDIASSGLSAVTFIRIDGDGTGPAGGTTGFDLDAIGIIHSGADCNGNGMPDECDIAEGNSDDCNGNDIPDKCDIVDGSSHDDDQDGIPDECQCPADFDGDGVVGPADLAQLLGSWGPYEPCPPFDAADFNEDCVVGAADLAQLLGSWGPCE